LRSLARRKLRTIMTVLGVALVVAVYSAMSSVVETMIQRFKTTGALDEVVIVQSGAMTIDFSQIDRGSLTYVQTLDGLARDGDRPLVSPELCLGSIVCVRGKETDVVVRGVTEIASVVYQQVRFADKSNWPGPAHAAYVGRALAHKLSLQTGDTLELEGERWTVAGLTDSEARVYDHEVWVDLDELAAATNRKSYSSYTLRASGATAVPALIEAVNEGRRFPLSAQTGAEFYARTGAMAMFMAYIGKFISLVIAVGAVFGGMNTMYSAVAGRRQEIGVLRALGFRRSAVLTSFVCESVAISLVGGAIGLVFGLGVSMIPVDLPMLPTGRVSLGLTQVVWSLALALLIGLVGGLLPALQASRLAVVDALRQ
jgi:ABC-type antimicrobial peptide transport system permease subunit